MIGSTPALITSYGANVNIESIQGGQRKDIAFKVSNLQLDQTSPFLLVKATYISSNGVKKEIINEFTVANITGFGNNSVKAESTRLLTIKSLENILTTRINRGPVSQDEFNVLINPINNALNEFNNSTADVSIFANAFTDQNYKDRIDGLLKDVQGQIKLVSFFYIL